MADLERELETVLLNGSVRPGCPLGNGYDAGVMRTYSVAELAVEAACPEL